MQCEPAIPSIAGDRTIREFCMKIFNVRRHSVNGLKGKNSTGNEDWLFFTYKARMFIPLLCYFLPSFAYVILLFELLNPRLI